MDWRQFNPRPRKEKASLPLGYSLINDDGWIAIQTIREDRLGCVSTVIWRSTTRVASSIVADDLPMQLRDDAVSSHTTMGVTHWRIRPGGRFRSQWELQTPEQGRLSRVALQKVDDEVQARRIRVLEQMAEHKGRGVRRFDMSKGRPTKWIIDAFTRWANLVVQRGTAAPEIDSFWDKLYKEADEAFGPDNGYVVVNQLYNDLGVDRDWGRVNPGDVVVLRKGKKVLALVGIVGTVPPVNWCEPLPEYVWVG